MARPAGIELRRPPKPDGACGARLSAQPRLRNSARETHLIHDNPCFYHRPHRRRLGRQAQQAEHHDNLRHIAGHARPFDTAIHKI